MATRSAVIIESASGRVTLYRHWDGQLAVAGAAVARACADAACAEDILAALLAERHEDGARVYELADQAGQAGEEHVYLVQYRCASHDLPRHRCVGREVLSIQHAARPWGRTDWLSWPRRTYTVSAFVDAVNADRREVNRRLAAARAAGEGWALAATDYDLL